MYNKFILLNDGNIIMGRVSFHRDMTDKPENISGGGMFTLNKHDKHILFWGKSHDFGEADLEMVTDAIMNDRVYWGKQNFKEYSFTVMDYLGVKHQIRN